MERIAQQMESIEQQQEIAAIRASLPAQQRAAAMDEARLQYRTLSYSELRRRIFKSLPFRLFHWRRVHEWDIREYPRVIPDAVLLKYAEARKAGLFRVFYILEPSYERQVDPIRPDPWLIGKVSGKYQTFLARGDRVAIIAYWE